MLGLPHHPFQSPVAFSRLSPWPLVTTSPSLSSLREPPINGHKLCHLESSGFPVSIVPVMLLDLLARERPPHPDVLMIPTPPLQQTALFIVFFFPALSVFTFGLRAYGRLSTRQWGLGTWESRLRPGRSLMLIDHGIDDWLCGLAVVRDPSSCIYSKVLSF